MGGLVRVTVLGCVPVPVGDDCRWCGEPLVVMYLGYSTADEVVDVERAQICEVCETVVMGDVGDWDEDERPFG
jgi:hypothetical protein